MTVSTPNSDWTVWVLLKTTLIFTDADYITQFNPSFPIFLIRPQPLWKKYLRIKSASNRVRSVSIKSCLYVLCKFLDQIEFSPVR